MSIFNDKALKSVAEAAAKVMQQEELKGNQHKIDANKNGKVDAHDFKLLRGKKNLKEDDTGYQDRYAVKNGKAVKHNPMRGERDEPHHVWADNADHAVRKHAAKTNAPMKEDVQQLDEKEGQGSSDPLANRADYAKRHGTGQVYKKTYPGDKTGMTKSYAYDIKRSGPKGKLPEEVEQLDEIGDTPAGQKMLRKVDSRAFYKGGTKSGGKGNMADAGEKTLERTQARIKKQPSLLSKAAGAVKKVLTREEVEELDEISAQTASNYLDKVKAKHGTNYNDLPKKRQRGVVNAMDIKMNAAEKKMKEETELDEAFPTVADAKKRMDAGKTATGSVTKTSKGLVHKRDYKDEDDADDAQKKSTGYGARQNYKRSTRVNEQLSFTEMLELYNEHGLKVLAPIETEEMDIDGTTIEVIDGDKINGYVETTVEEEVTNDEFTKEYEDQKASFEGKKKQPKVAAGKTTGVKNMPEEYELDERSLTSDEKSEMEKNVKGMKKKLSSFKDRYGDDAKSVMYATATKMAKEDIDSDETIDELYNPVSVKKGVRRSVDSSGKVSYSGGVRVKGSGASSAGKVIGHNIDVQKRKESMFKQKHPVLSKIKSAGSAVSKAIDKVASIKIGNKNRAGG